VVASLKKKQRKDFSLQSVTTVPPQELIISTFTNFQFVLNSLILSTEPTECNVQTKNTGCTFRSADFGNLQRDIEMIITN
jgi:hypothetical protein